MRWRRWIGLLLLTAMVVLGLRLRSSPSAPSPAAPAGVARARTLPAALAPRLAAPAPTDGVAAGEESTVAERRLERAERTLETYRQSTRYPPDSQPMRRHPDMEQPHFVPAVPYPLAHHDGRHSGARVTVRQDRRFLVADETAALSLECSSGDGAESCQVLGAYARRLVSPLFEGRSEGVRVAFQEQEPGLHVATFQPSRQGFAGYAGLIRIDLTVRMGNEQGATGFQLEYTPEAPATFTGRIDEALEHGSVLLRIGLLVARQGRYVLHARLDDATGNTVALLTFNDLLGSGDQVAVMPLFGRLLLDERPAQPWHLRDLEGFRLLEDATPDRELMAMRAGRLHTTRRYTASELSPDEWQSEQKTRYLGALTADVERARREVEAQHGP